ncbi:MAG: hypothetical protein R2932_17155 [Caldilineaceae bacterium]
MNNPVFQQRQISGLGRKGMVLAAMLGILIGAMVLPGRQGHDVQAAAITNVSAVQNGINPPHSSGTIAYAADDGLWLVNADGTDSRRIWQLPDPATQQITGLDWSPDGTRIAFAANHESLCSLYRADIYSINIDGTNLRRLTNSPACGELAGFPKGSVQVTLRNNLTESLFLLYVEGAPEAIEVPIPPGTVRTVTVENVADFGDGVLQQLVLFQTDQRNWVNSAVTVDVRPNTTTAASADFLINNENSFTTNRYGVNFPSWQRDGQAVAFTFGGTTARQIAANPTVAQPSTKLFPEGSIFASRAELSPIDEQVLLYSYPQIGLGTVGDAASVNPILNLSGTLFGMDWLVDGSGLVGGENLGLGETHANLWRYTFGASEVINLTNFDDENRGYAADPGVSPDGTEIVYIYAPTSDAAAELQIMDIDGGNVRSLGVSGLYPDWGMPSQVVQPTPTPSATATGAPRPTPTPLPTLDPAEVADTIYLPVVQR